MQEPTGALNLHDFLFIAEGTRWQTLNPLHHIRLNAYTFAIRCILNTVATMAFGYGS